jgi:hypoxanthine phosphoribosyltransferase
LDQNQYTHGIVKLLISEDRIQKRIRALARQIAKDFRGREVLCIGVLKGSFIFLADLARKVRIPLKMDFVRLASYGTGTRSSGKIKLTKDLETSLRGKDVLIVDDIVDTGLTLKFLFSRLRARKPRCLKIVALLDKPSRRVARVSVDYVGFQIPNHFVVGYGLDYREKYRNLRGIYILKK